MRGVTAYPVPVGEPSLQVHQVAVDGTPLGLTMISAEDRVIALHGVDREHWSRARISVRLQVPETELREGPWADITGLLILSERRTNSRLCRRLEPDSPGRLAGEIDLHHDRHGQSAVLRARLVATVDGIPGRVIAESSPWILELDSRVPRSRETTVTTVWRDFTSAEDPFLQRFREDPWTVDTSEDPPVLYLNRGFEGLYSVLQDTKAAHRAPREMVAAEIGQDVWTVLFDAALDEARVDNGVCEWPSGWHEGVLRRLLPDMFPELPPDDALTEALTRREDTDGGGELAVLLAHAASVQARRNRRMVGFLRELQRDSEGET